MSSPPSRDAALKGAPASPPLPHEGRTPGKPAALKPSHWDELVQPRGAEDSAAVRNRDAKKQGHTKKENEE